MNGNDNVTNATWLTNLTVGENTFTAEYVKFNYIMVGVSFGILLVIIIIAKVLCACNQEPHYDKVDLSNALRLKDDEMMAPNFVRGAHNNGSHHDYGGPQHVPGEISDEEDPEDGGGGFQEPPARSAGIWHTPPVLPPHGGQQHNYSSKSRSVASSHDLAPSSNSPLAPKCIVSLSRTTPATSPPPETEANCLLRHLEAVMADDGIRPKGSSSSSFLTKKRTGRFSWPNCDVESSAPSDGSAQYLVDIT